MYTKGGCENPFGNIFVPTETGLAQCGSGLSLDGYRLLIRA
jgi:hypothetical protein